MNPALVYAVVLWFAPAQGDQWRWDIQGFELQKDCFKAYAANIQKYQLPRNEHACAEPVERWKVDFYHTTKTPVTFTAVKE